MSGASIVKIAMFDEVNEGTAILRLPLPGQMARRRDIG
jgi:hypothetical protein